MNVIHSGRSRWSWRPADLDGDEMLKRTATHGTRQLRERVRFAMLSMVAGRAVVSTCASKCTRCSQITKREVGSLVQLAGVSSAVQDCFLLKTSLLPGKGEIYIPSTIHRASSRYSGNTMQERMRLHLCVNLGSQSMHEWVSERLREPLFRRSLESNSRSIVDGQFYSLSVSTNSCLLFTFPLISRKHNREPCSLCGGAVDGAGWCIGDFAKNRSRIGRKRRGRRERTNIGIAGHAESSRQNRPPNVVPMIAVPTKKTVGSRQWY